MYICRCDRNLAQVADALAGNRFVLCFREGGQKKACEDRDDRNNNQQLNERKGALRLNHPGSGWRALHVIEMSMPVAVMNFQRKRSGRGRVVNYFVTGNWSLVILHLCESPLSPALLDK